MREEREEDRQKDRGRPTRAERRKREEKTS